MTIGPRFADAHELPLEVVDRADAIATDSLPQLDAADQPHLVSGQYDGRLLELAEVLEEPTLGRTAADDVTLFCSVGLAGTEVVLGSRFLEAFA
ncbi:ornithine cyclodeaminase [Natronorubrum tibetense GA33]|uniref:Ornithine cyclodeaminase n=2 Tax=Natronorubrum tibetense TaxID=63128 RepID=L9W3L9_9EURY|nr:ornithine cyclodeaminase [Natronorubrum tibetense GA33]